MGKALKGITVEINGSTENLVKALEKPNAEAASLQKELSWIPKTRNCWNKNKCF